MLNGYLWVATPRESLVMPAGSASSLGLFLAGRGGVPDQLGRGHQLRRNLKAEGHF